MVTPLRGDRNDITFGILMLDTTFPRILGDVGHPETFSFPVIHRVIQGAGSRNVVIDTDSDLLPLFIEGARALVKQGARAISTSCGFLAVFQRELASALDVPVFSSSLLQVHLARAVIRPDQKVGILTARRASLTEKHLTGVGIAGLPLAIVGMDEAEEFTATFIHGKETIDIDRCRREVEAAAVTLMASHPDVGAIVLECTNMPPYADSVRRITGLPVFDVVTMLEYAYLALSKKAYDAGRKAGFPGS